MKNGFEGISPRIMGNMENTVERLKKNKNEKIFVLLFKHDSKHLKMYILNKNTLNVSLKEYDYSILMFSTFFERNMFTLIFL